MLSPFALLRVDMLGDCVKFHPLRISEKGCASVLTTPPCASICHLKSIQRRPYSSERQSSIAHSVPYIFALCLPQSNFSGLWKTLIVLILPCRPAFYLESWRLAPLARMRSDHCRINEPSFKTREDTLHEACIQLITNATS